MNNEEAKTLVRCVFQSIEHAESEYDFGNIVEKDPILKKNRFDPSKYPDLKISLTVDDIANLKKSGILSGENKILPVKETSSHTALEKLLYSVLWKNGDLGKEVHIVEGVLSTEEGKDDSSKENGLVFYQYGKHLAKREEPIVDQHTIRAFLLFKNLNSSDSVVTIIRKKGTLEREDLLAFKEWIALRTNGGVEQQFHIDKVLFALGKSIKITRSKRKST